MLDSPFNRSVNANVAMQLVGPAAGSRLVKTNADPSGTRCFGTFGNCGNGYTLWNTYLTCEENFTDYFGISNAAPASVNYPDTEYQRHMERYKGTGKTSSSSYRWDYFDDRFNWSIEPNEYNRCGWIVEIDPFDPNSTPKKLTALGRFKHENAAMTLADDKRVVVYMGDDQASEYIYKFVSDGKYDPARPALNRLLLDKGTLYVARFLDGAAQGDAMGVGEWIPLKLDTPALAGGTLGALFNQDMGELLVKTRQAADAVGATPMDRPEWITTHPVTREAYVTLTNNSSRGSGNDRYPGTKHPGPNDANPRANNVYGQIVRWREKSGDPASLSFEWDIFVLAGNPTLYPRTDLRSARPTSPPRTPSTTPTAWLSTSAACCGSRPTATTQHRRVRRPGQQPDAGRQHGQQGNPPLHDRPGRLRSDGPDLDAGPEVPVHQHPAPGRRPERDGCAEQSADRLEMAGRRQRHPAASGHGGDLEAGRHGGGQLSLDRG